MCIMAALLNDMVSVVFTTVAPMSLPRSVSIKELSQQK